jgi:PAS domain S-box-containing protein
VSLVSSTASPVEDTAAEADRRQAATVAALGLVDAVPQAIVMTDLAGRILVWNRAAEALYGWPAEEVLGRLIQDVTVPGMSQDQASEIMARLAEGEAWEGTFSVQRRDGSTFPARVIDTPIRDEHGELVAILGQSEDISERLEADRRLKQSEMRFRRLADAVPQLVWTARSTGEVTYYSSRAQRYAGLVEHEDGTWRWAGVLHPDDLDHTNAAWARAVETSAPYEAEHRVRMADGSFRWHLSRAEPVVEDGAVTWYGTATDMHDHKLAEEALQERELQLRGALAAKEELLGLVSHELRTPLTVILGMGALLRRGADPEAVRDGAAEIVDSAERLERLVESMLTLARADREEAAWLLEPLLVEKAVRNVIDRMQQRDPSRALTIEARADGALVEGQQAWLEQVIENLVSNAAKYSPAERPIRVVVSRDDTEVSVRVLDEGSPVEDQHLERIFEPFYRTPAAERSASGAGLGLAVCNRLVDLMGGRIWAAARAEGGSEFGFALPALSVPSD